MQTTESEAQTMVVDTDKYYLTMEQIRQLRLANARLVAEKGQLIFALNRWQGVAQAALGNVQKLAKEMQVYLRNGGLPG